MRWIARLFGREDIGPSVLSGHELVEALQEWRTEHEYAWWLNENLDTVSLAVRQQLGLFRETGVIKAVHATKDISEDSRLRLVEGVERLIGDLDRSRQGSIVVQELWPGLSCQQFNEAVVSLREGARKVLSLLATAAVVLAYQEFKDALENWLAASVPMRYRLNQYMRHTMPQQLVASLPTGMLPTEPPKALRRYI